MAAEPTRDIEALLAPISETAVAGVNLREDTSPSSPYFLLKDARSAARAAERRAETQASEGGLLTEWQTILTTAPQVLKEKSKDLEIAVWYLEALVRADGFVGLRDGYRLILGLVENFWETMFSLEDEDGMLTRLAPLAGLNGVEAEGALIQPLRKAPITDRNGDDGPYSAYHYEQAWSLEQVADATAKARRTERGDVTMEQFTAAVNASGATFYIQLLEEIAGALATFDAATSALDERAGADSPPSSSIRDLLKTIQDTVQAVSKAMVDQYRARNQAAQPAAESGESGELVKANGAGEPQAGGFQVSAATLVRGREEALQVLLRVAEYFRTTEPHSPISTTLEEVVRRARMPFSDLLAELLPDETTWRSALTNAGIKPPNGNA